MDGNLIIFSFLFLVVASYARYLMKEDITRECLKDKDNNECLRCEDEGFALD